jgi:hypothetical protein
MNQLRPTREQLIELARRDPEAIADLVLSLWDRVEALERKVAELQRNSRTSSKPTSSDKGNFANPPKPSPHTSPRLAQSPCRAPPSSPPYAAPIPFLYVSCDGTGTPMRRKELKGIKGKQPGGGTVVA